MKIIFTDLDGTLLDQETYAYDDAKPALDYLKKNNIPIIFCTSKTSKEILFWKNKIDNTHPFISENGGGIFLPNDYFSKKIDVDDHIPGYSIIRLGIPVSDLKDVIDELKETFDITSFLDMSVDQIAEIADLSIKQARLAKQREFSIPFILHQPDKENDLKKEIKKHKLFLTKGGRFYHLMGDNDKGKAVKIVSSLYKNENECIKSIGIGDSENDFSMLVSVDNAYLVKKPNDIYETSSFAHVNGIGPKGWKLVIEKEFKF